MTARRAVATIVGEQRAALWVLDRALDGVPASRYVAGVVQVARTLNDRRAWTEVVAMARQMVRIRADRSPTLG